MNSLEASIFEKVVVLLIGTVIMYYAGNLMMDRLVDDKDHEIEVFIKSLGKNVMLNSYERCIYDDVIHKDDISESFDNIVGHETIKEDIKTVFIEPINEKLDVDLPNGMILHGPPGTGKSMLARCIAKESNTCFINFSMTNIENKLYGESQKYMNAVFTLAKKLSPCVIFIDELDGFGSSRSSMDQHHINSLKTQFLRQIDGVVKDKSKIICIGATNRLNAIDSAMRRRMRKHVQLCLPDLQEIKILFEKHLGILSENLSDDMIGKCVGFSGSDVYELCKNIKIYSRKNKNIKDVFHNQLKSFTYETSS